MEDDATAAGEGPPPKKRKKDIEPGCIFYPDLTITVRAADAEKFELRNPTFLTLDNLEYITFNSDKSSYLYSICAVLFDVTTEQLKILKSSVGVVLPENSEKWQVVAGEDPITKGNYLLTFEETSSPNLDLYWVKKSSGTAGTPATSAPTTPTQSVTLHSPLPIERSTLVDANRLTMRSSKMWPYIQSKTEDWKCRRKVALRDNSCILTNTEEDMCVNSHAIPRRLVYKTDVIASGIRFETEYDLNVSILLEPNLDWTFNRYLGSIFRDDDVFVWQIYRNESKNRRSHYNTTTWDLAEAKETARVADSHRLKIALQWHCRNALVRNWCSDEVRKKSGFEEPDSEDGIAMMYYLDTPECLPFEFGEIF